jgi:hypothetical protein
MKTMAEKIEDLVNELEQLAIDADDIGWIAVNHKVTEALGPLRSAHGAAKQLESTFI